MRIVEMKFIFPILFLILSACATRYGVPEEYARKVHRDPENRDGLRPQAGRVPWHHTPR